MSASKITISIEKQLLDKVDQLVQSHLFGNRSQAIQSAVKDKIDRLEHVRLAEACAKLDQKTEQDVEKNGTE